MPAGRPTKYKKRYCQDLIDHMSQGYSFESFAGLIGTTKDTIYAWSRKHKEFSDAKKAGTEASRMFWERMAVDNLINSTETRGKSSSSKSLNSTVWIFNMKNRFGWRDRVENFDRDDIDGIDFEDPDSEE